MKHNANTPRDEEFEGNMTEEAEVKSTYKGRYEADPVPEQDEAPDAESDDYDEDDIYEEKTVKHKKKRSPKDIIVKSASIVLSLVIILLLVLNMPIIAYSKKGKPVENVSIITFFKRWQPLVYKEGELASNSMSNLDVNSEIVHDEFNDGLDLPQIIEGQFSVLVMGFDDGNGNSDVMWIFQFDIAAAKMSVLQIPRDTFAPSYTSSYAGRFNSIYSLGDSEKTPVQRTVDAVQDHFGIPIDAYITTNCYDIVEMVDLVGGIEITLDEQIVYEADKIIPAGTSTLTGQQAEWFMRFRRGFAEGDIGRVKNQRKFLAAAMQKMLNIVENEGKLKFYSYLKEIYENEYILTNLSLESISKLADLAATIDMNQVYVTMVPGEGEWYYPEGHARQSVWSVHKQATLDILNEHFRPYQNDLTPEQSAIVELVTDYTYTSYDNTGDTLQDLQEGVKPGENKPKATEASTEAST